MRRLGNLLLVVGVCLLLLVGVRSRPLAAPEADLPEQKATVVVPPADTASERIVSAAQLVEEGVEALRQKLEGEEVEADESLTATPEQSTLEAVVGRDEELPERESEAQKAAPPATRLVIPALGVDAPVVEVPIVNKTWDVSGLTYEIAHLAGTANPGEKNNMALAGHVTLRRGAGPFLNLESLEPGDMAIVYAGEQAYTYRVVSKRYIGPTDVSVAYPTSEPILTLITCTNWDAVNRTYTERVAVIAELVAELVEEEPFRRGRIEPSQ